MVKCRKVLDYQKHIATSRALRQIPWIHHYWKMDDVVNMMVSLREAVDVMGYGWYVSENEEYGLVVSDLSSVEPDSRKCKVYFQTPLEYVNGTMGREAEIVDR